MKKLKFSFFILAFFQANFCSFAGGVIIGRESRVTPDERQRYSRFVRFRPANGQTVTLNPPRFSWPFDPKIAVAKYHADTRFTLQISKTKSFAEPDVEIRDTDCNFYNFLPVLKGAKIWYWRVGYRVGSKRKVQWSDVRSFTLADDAVEWNRSDFGRRIDALSGHPRILFNRKTRRDVLAMRKKNPYSAELAEHIIQSADAFMKNKSRGFRAIPQDDSRKLKVQYRTLADGLTRMAFAYLLTGDEKYMACKDKFVLMASWPKGGLSSPEGIREDTNKWETHLTEYLGVFYDWFYDVLTPEERKIIRNSLAWRIDHTLNSFAWKRRGGEEIKRGSIAVSASSHAYQNTMPMIIGSLAVCDELPVARKALAIGLHYIIGITSGMGEDECWKEGPGYGNGKMKWLMDASSYLETTIPSLNLGKNEMYSAYADFFARLTPVGVQHSSFGNRGINELDWGRSRAKNLYRVALFRNDGVALQNSLDSVRRLEEHINAKIYPEIPWIDFALPFYFSEPQPRVETVYSKLFPVEGWVTVSTAPPSDYDAQKNAVSMSFRCSPRGGYGHSFRCENAFDLHAYGITMTVGGGNTANQNQFANATMSHNTVLINGLGQLAAKDRTPAFCGRIIAWKKGDRFIYWAGDATAAYGPKTGLAKFVRHVLFVDGEYFVIYDQLSSDRNTGPARFQWLYHILPYTELDFNPKKFSWRYAIKDTEMVVKHLAHTDDLTFLNLRGREGQFNPVTGEDLRQRNLNKYYPSGKIKKVNGIPPPADANHIWVSHKTPREKMDFLTVLVPFRKGEKPPVIEGGKGLSARITFRGKTKTICFDPAADNKSADIIVRLSEIVD